jgi:hypothetical protein
MAAANINFLTIDSVLLISSVLGSQQDEITPYSRSLNVDAWLLSRKLCHRGFWCLQNETDGTHVVSQLQQSTRDFTSRGFNQAVEYNASRLLN